MDAATDNFFTDPVRYFVEPPKAAVDKKKLDQLFNKYRSELTLERYTLYVAYIQVYHVCGHESHASYIYTCTCTYCCCTCHSVLEFVTLKTGLGVHQKFPSL